MAADGSAGSRAGPGILPAAAQHFTAVNAARDSCRFWLGILPY
ncbi:MAG: hypothetical protein VB138_08515 [Burkholderia sp.]